MDQPVHIGELVIGADDAADMQAGFAVGEMLADEIFELRHSVARRGATAPAAIRPLLRNGISPALR